MMEDRKVQTKHLVESGASIINTSKLAQAGTLSEADAKKAATEALRAVRYDGTTTCSSWINATTTSCCRPSPRWKARTPAA
jgi:hypothetical protein